MAKKTIAPDKTVAKRLCSQPPLVKRKFASNVAPNRMKVILSTVLKWANGTEIKFMFVEGATAQKNVVRAAFEKWKSLGIGLSFKEVATREESMVRIGFDYNDGSWSYVGRDILTIPKEETTMNFGWDLTADSYGMTTALHEIGHTLGFQHEHQSPFAGITWNTKAVYKEFSGPPNKWPKKEIDSNILNKLTPNQVQGTDWDPKSIMEYEFGAGLVLKPAAYVNGIFPPGTLSQKDIDTVKSFYPVIKPSLQTKLDINKVARIKAGSGGQDDFIFTAPLTKKYTFQTTGNLDTVMVISEIGKTENHYMAGDDDSGYENNAKIILPLVKGRKYLVNVKVTYAPEKPNGSIVAM
jgi:hypothetical protein